MKTSFWLLVLLLGASPEDLFPVALNAVEISVPRSWRKSKQAGTVRFGVPNGEAYLELDVSTVKVSGGLPAQTCVDKIIQGIGGKDWRGRVIDNAPAALRMDVDKDAEGKQFVSYTYVGCNGKTTWAVSFHWIGLKDQQFAPLAEKIAASVRYRRMISP